MATRTFPERFPVQPLLYHFKINSTAYRTYFSAFGEKRYADEQEVEASHNPPVTWLLATNQSTGKVDESVLKKPQRRNVGCATRINETFL